MNCSTPVVCNGRVLVHVWMMPSLVQASRHAWDLHVRTLSSAVPTFRQFQASSFPVPFNLHQSDRPLYGGAKTTSTVRSAVIS